MSQCALVLKNILLGCEVLDKYAFMSAGLCGLIVLYLLIFLWTYRMFKHRSSGGKLLSTQHFLFPFLFALKFYIYQG